CPARRSARSRHRCRTHVHVRGTSCRKTSCRGGAERGKVWGPLQGRAGQELRHRQLRDHDPTQVNGTAVNTPTVTEADRTIEEGNGDRTFRLALACGTRVDEPLSSGHVPGALQWSWSSWT